MDFNETKKMQTFRKSLSRQLGNVSVYTNYEKCLQSLNRRWLEHFRTRRESNIFHCSTNQILLYSQNGASYNHSLNQITIKLNHNYRFYLVIYSLRSMIPVCDYMPYACIVYCFLLLEA